MVLDRGVGSRWSIIIALVGCLIVEAQAAPGSLAQSGMQDEHSNSEQTDRNNDQSRGSESTLASTIEPIEQIEGAEYNAPCAKGQDNRNSDLCAQWKAADSASDAAWWAEWQTYLAFIGVVGLVYNLYLTRTATKIAGDATKDADRALQIATRNADAAAAQVAVAESTARRQLRAYLILESIKFEYVKKGNQLQMVIARLPISNMGQTPGVVLDAFINKVVIKGNDDFPPPPINTIPELRLRMPVHSKPKMFGIRNVTREELIDLGLKKNRIFLFAIIRYTDIFLAQQEIVEASELILHATVEQIEREGDPVARFNDCFECQTVLNFGHST